MSLCRLTCKPKWDRTWVAYVPLVLPFTITCFLIQIAIRAMANTHHADSIFLAFRRIIQLYKHTCYCFKHVMSAHWWASSKHGAMCYPLDLFHFATEGDCIQMSYAECPTHLHTFPYRHSDTKSLMGSCPRASVIVVSGRSCPRIWCWNLCMLWVKLVKISCIYER